MKSRRVFFVVIMVFILAVYATMMGCAPAKANAEIKTAKVKSQNIIKVGPGQKYKTISSAVKAAKAGYTIEIDAKGTYFGKSACSIIDKDGLTLKGVNGTPKMEADPEVELPDCKGIWVITASDVTVDNIEFTGAHDNPAKFPDSKSNPYRKNWAGIRIDYPVAGKTTIKNCYLHNNDDGVLATPQNSGSVVVENCELAFNGYRSAPGEKGDGASHNFYDGWSNESLTFRYNYSHDSTEGHLLKTRAKTGYIEYNLLADENADGQWCANSNIDMPDAGIYYVIGNVFQQSPGGNDRMLSYGVEGAKNSGRDLYVINNTFVNDVTNMDDCTFIQIRDDSSVNAVVKNNIFTGKGAILQHIYADDLSKTVDSSNLKNVDPGYVNRAKYDYHLTSAATAAIDKGVDPGKSSDDYSLVPVKQYAKGKLGYEKRPVSGALDIGAFEYVGVK